MPHDDKNQHQMETLVEHAKALGATDAMLVATASIQATKELAALCNGDYTCPNYGRSASCPPHVEGPECFRRWQSESRFSIAIKIELPSSVMFSDGRRDIVMLLHTIVAGVEQEAVALGYKNSRAFAGSSCKTLFCRDEKTCRVVDEDGECRHPESARPSMSGFGIDVTGLMKSCGWASDKAVKSDSSTDEDMSWVAGLVMLA